jgi:hypothetical protein
LCKLVSLNNHLVSFILKSLVHFESLMNSFKLDILLILEHSTCEISKTFCETFLAYVELTIFLWNLDSFFEAFLVHGYLPVPLDSTWLKRRKWLSVCHTYQRIEKIKLEWKSIDCLFDLGVFFYLLPLICFNHVDPSTRWYLRDYDYCCATINAFELARYKYVPAIFGRYGCQKCRLYSTSIFIGDWEKSYVDTFR